MTICTGKDTSSQTRKRGVARASAHLVVLAVVGHEAEVGVVAGLDSEGHGVVRRELSLEGVGGSSEIRKIKQN